MSAYVHLLNGKVNAKVKAKNNLSCETIVLNTTTREAKRALEFRIETVSWWNYFVVFN